MKAEVWDLRVYDVFCLDCDEKMEYYGYESCDKLDGGNIINSETYETKDVELHIFLNFKCSQCKKKSSVMTH